MVQRLKCRKKRKWGTKKAAIRASHSINDPRLLMKHYRCKYCGSYHLTTRPRRAI